MELGPFLELGGGEARQLPGGLLVLSRGDEDGGVADLVPGQHPLRVGLADLRQRVEGAPDPDPLPGGGVGDAEHGHDPGGGGGGAIVTPALLAIDGADHLEQLRRRGGHQRRQLLGGIGEVAMGLFHQRGDPCRRARLLDRLGHGSSSRTRSTVSMGAGAPRGEDPHHIEHTFACQPGNRDLSRPRAPLCCRLRARATDLGQQ